MKITYEQALDALQNNNTKVLREIIEQWNSRPDLATLTLHTRQDYQKITPLERYTITIDVDEQQFIFESAICTVSPKHVAKVECFENLKGEQELIVSEVKELNNDQKN